MKMAFGHNGGNPGRQGYSSMEMSSQMALMAFAGLVEARGVF